MNVIKDVQLYMINSQEKQKIELYRTIRHYIHTKNPTRQQLMDYTARKIAKIRLRAKQDRDHINTEEVK